MACMLTYIDARAVTVATLAVHFAFVMIYPIFSRFSIILFFGIWFFKIFFDAKPLCGLQLELQSHIQY